VGGVPGGHSGSAASILAESSQQLASIALTVMAVYLYPREERFFFDS
jgi:hypothetical protein